MFGVAMRTEGINYGGGDVENFLLKIAVNFSSIVDTFPGFLIIIHIDAATGQHKSTISRNQSLFIALRGGKGVYRTLRRVKRFFFWVGGNGGESVVLNRVERKEHRNLIPMKGGGVIRSLEIICNMLLKPNFDRFK